MNINRNTIVAVSVLIILLPLGYSAVYAVFARGGEASEPFIEMPDGETCVGGKSGEYMRYHHMDFLKDIRDDAVRKGERGEIGINSCRECHTSRERFCNQCHDAVNLHLGCFHCHYYPLNP